MKINTFKLYSVPDISIIIEYITSAHFRENQWNIWKGERTRILWIQMLYEGSVLWQKSGYLGKSSDE